MFTGLTSSRVVLHITFSMQPSDDALYELLGDRVKNARVAAKLSQGQLAKKLGLHRVSVVNIEKGRQRPPLHVLSHFARELNVELIQLIPRDGDFEDVASGVKLDADSVKQLENATKSDLPTRRLLESFIRRAKGRNAE
jgi:transcriptional regulator with XRE-family HTH domain